MKREVIARNRDTVKDPQIRELLSTLSEHYPIGENGKGRKLTPNEMA